MKKSSAAKSISKNASEILLNTLSKDRHFYYELEFTWFSICFSIIMLVLSNNLCHIIWPILTLGLAIFSCYVYYKSPLFFSFMVHDFRQCTTKSWKTFSAMGLFVVFLAAHAHIETKGWNPDTMYGADCFNSLFMLFAAFYAYYLPTIWFIILTTIYFNINWPFTAYGKSSYASKGKHHPIKPPKPKISAEIIKFPGQGQKKD